MDPKKTARRPRDPEAAMRRILSELAAERSSHGHGEAGQIDKRMGRAKGYLGRVIRQEVRLDLQTLFQALEALDADPADFFARAVGARLHPPGLLARLERQEAREDACVLDRFRLHFVDNELEVAVARPQFIADSYTLKEELKELEERAFSKPAATLPEAERVVLDAVYRLGSTGSQGSLEVTARALGLVALIYRRMARFGSAAGCLRLGFRLCELGEDCRKARAELLQRTCYLLIDHGEYEIARELSREATETYVLLGDDDGVGKSLVDRAVIYGALSQSSRAIEAFHRSLTYLSGKLWYSQCTALHGLGYGYMDADRLEMASDYAEKAAKIHKTRKGPNWSRLVWLRGEIALRQERTEDAEEHLREALGELRSESNFFDVAIVSLRLAQTLLLDGRLEEVQAIAADMMRLLYPLRNHRIASAALSEVTRAALKGELTYEFLEAVCARLEHDKGRPGKGRPPAVN